MFELGVKIPTKQHPTAFNALNLLAVHQEKQLACKMVSNEVLACLSEIKNCFPFWCSLHRL